MGLFKKKKVTATNQIAGWNIPHYGLADKNKLQTDYTKLNPAQRQQEQQTLKQDLTECRDIKKASDNVVKKNRNETQTKIAEIDSTLMENITTPQRPNNDRETFIEVTVGEQTRYLTEKSIKAYKDNNPSYSPEKTDLLDNLLLREKGDANRTQLINKTIESIETRLDTVNEVSLSQAANAMKGSQANAVNTVPTQPVPHRTAQNASASPVNGPASMPPTTGNQPQANKNEITPI